jgi:hypothetical protein
MVNIPPEVNEFPQVYESFTQFVSGENAYLNWVAQLVHDTVIEIVSLVTGPVATSLVNVIVGAA